MVKKNAIILAKKKYLLLLIYSFFTFFNLLNAKELDLKLLDKKEQSIITISAFTANGDLKKLSKALNKGLDSKLTINEIKEVIVHLYAYTGFPRSLNSLNLFMKIVEERKTAGKNDILGKEASPKPKDYNSIEYGKKIRAKLAGLKEDYTGAAYQIFAPAIDEYLLGHLFGDIFVRDVLTHKQRELATISALAAMSGTESQIKFHYKASMNTGWTKDELNEFIKVIENNLGEKEAGVANKVLQSL